VRLLSLYSDQCYSFLVGTSLTVVGGRNYPESEGCVCGLGIR
jgi:hypothetical protein